MLVPLVVKLEQFTTLSEDDRRAPDADEGACTTVGACFDA